MAFKKPYDEKDLRKKNVRVKNSYYTFSKDYPIGNLTKRKSTQKKENRILIRRIAVYSICFFIIAFLSFFVTETALKFSYKEPSTEVTETTPVTDEDLQDEPENEVFSLKAFYLPEDKITDTKYIKDLISQIKHYDGSSVVINFKTKDGHLAYTSNSKYITTAEASLYDNETVRKALSLFKSKGINIVAQVYCFEDPLMSAAKSEMAVKYMETDVSWLDSTEENDGKTWLNPYSKDARNYLLDLVSEIESFGVNGFILKAVSFPSKGSLDTAGYPGEKNNSERNNILQSFIKSVKEKVSPNSFVLISQSIDETINSNTPYLFGTLVSSEADGFCADISKRSDEYVIDRKTQYSSILSLFASLENAVGSNEKLVFEIEKSEVSFRLLNELSKNGYDNFIVYE